MEFNVLSAFEKGLLNVIIETPKGSRNKYSFEKKANSFLLKKTPPAGFIFPYDFGSIPNTEGEDGDPLDALVLLDEPCFPGILVRCNIIGVLKAAQKERHKLIRNDRIVAAGNTSDRFKYLKFSSPEFVHLRKEIEHFFADYNLREGKKFIPEGWKSEVKARKIIYSAIVNPDYEKNQK